MFNYDMRKMKKSLGSLNTYDEHSPLDHYNDKLPMHSNNRGTLIIYV